MTYNEPLSNFEIKDGVLVRYLGNQSHVIVPEGVHTIGEKAFVRIVKVKRVTKDVDRSALDGIGPMFWDAYLLSPSCKTIEIVTYEDQEQGIECINRVTLPEGVKVIAESAFKRCGGLVRVDLPQSLCIIGESAFAHCKKLKQIEIPSGVRELGVWAFFGCKSLTSIELPEHMTSIGRSAFYNCTALESVRMPKTLETMGDRLFDGCSALRSAEFPCGVAEIPRGTFERCYALEKVFLPDTVKTIGHSAFSNCVKLRKVALPESVEHIEGNAFLSCTSLERLDLPPNLKSVEKGAFWGCGVKALDFPATIEGEIPSCVDERCENLTQITLRTPVEWRFGAELRSAERIEHIFVSRAIYEKWDGYYDGCLKTKFPKVKLLEEDA